MTEAKNWLYRQEQQAQDAEVTVQAAKNARSRSAKVDRILERLLERAARLVDFDAGAVYLANEEGPQATRGGGLKPCIVEQVHRQRRPRLVTDENCGAEGQGWLAVPLLAGEEWLGIICLEASGTPPFTNQDLHLIGTLAAQTAVLLQNALLSAEVRHNRQNINRLVRQLVAAQEEERRRLAQELHDGPNQLLAALYLGLGLIEDDNAPEPEFLSEMGELALETVEQLQHIVQNLHPPALEQSTLTAAIKQLCSNFAQQHQLSVVCEGDELSPLSEDAALSLYRFVQEALTNVSYHAEAQEVRVKLSRNGNHLQVQVQDDGRGFDGDVLASNPTEYSGLHVIRHRLQLVGGNLAVDASPGEGVVVTATLQL